MAFYPAHCDNNCKGCEKNSCGWCLWKDRATPYYNDFARAIFASNCTSYDADTIAEYAKDIN